MKRSRVLLIIPVVLLTACRAPLSPTAMPVETTQASKPFATLVSGPNAGAILFEDNFSNPQRRWDVTSGKDGRVGYENGAYQITVDKDLFSLWGNPGQSFDDVSAVVDAQAIEPPIDTEMGVMCRYQDKDNFIYGDITSDGFYGILQMKNGEPTVLTGDGKLTRTNAIKTGGEINRVQFVCAGDTFTLIVNDRVVDRVKAVIAAQGDVGLLAGTFDKPGAVARFDNFIVTLPGKDTASTASTAAGADQLLDDFSNDKSGWDVTSSENGSTGYGDGVFVIKVKTSNYSLWANPGAAFKDVAAEVDATPAAGPVENEMGVICRYQDGDNFVYASIGSNGFYGIYEVKAGKAKVLTGGGKLAPSAAIKPGQAINHILLQCRGSEYTLIVNEQMVDAVHSDTIMEGDVGLIAGAFDTGGVEIHFDNFSANAK